MTGSQIIKSGIKTSIFLYNKWTWINKTVTLNYFSEQSCANYFFVHYCLSVRGSEPEGIITETVQIIGSCAKQQDQCAKSTQTCSFHLINKQISEFLLKCHFVLFDLHWGAAGDHRGAAVTQEVRNYCLFFFFHEAQIFHKQPWKLIIFYRSFASKLWFRKNAGVTFPPFVLIHLPSCRTGCCQLKDQETTFHICWFLK